MLVSTAVFVVGVSLEKNQGHSESGIEQTHIDEGSEGHKEGRSGEGEGAVPHSEESETIGAISVESTPLIVLGAVLSMALREHP